MSESPVPEKKPRLGRRERVLLAIAGGLGVLGIVVLLLVRTPEPIAGDPAPVATAGAELAPPDTGEPVVLDLGAEVAASPMVVLAVHDPSAVRQALSGNAWLQSALADPLGQGFLGSWRAFLGTRGEDLAGKLEGTVLDLVAGRLLASPMRLMWLGGGTPALVIDAPGAESRAAYALLDALARRTRYTAEHCPAAVGVTPTGEGLEVVRWLIADHAVYAGRRGERMVFARRPLAVVHGLCTTAPAWDRGPGTALELGFYPQALGREAQLLAHLLGLDDAPRLGFAVVEERFVPTGIAAALLASERLASAALSEDLLRVVPEDAPVVLAAHLKLPANLGAASLSAYFAGASAPVETRTAALVWFPHGDDRTSEVALVWSRTQDHDALATAFAGTNSLAARSICNHEVLASSEALLARFDAACARSTPALANSSPAVLAGLRAEGSLVLGVQLGRLLARVLHDAWAEEAGASKPPVPPEIDAAMRRLEELPFLGFRGAARGRALVPGGFRS